MSDATRNQDADPIAVLSDPELIRARLARAVTEADILRRALRIAERAERDRREAAGAPAGGAK